MQLSALASTPVSPIGVASLGTLRIGHALNGVSFTEHRLVAPVTRPAARFTGSLADAVTGAQQLLTAQDASGSTRGVLALVGDGANGWLARVLVSDPTIVRAIDTG